MKGGGTQTRGSYDHGYCLPEVRAGHSPSPLSRPDVLSEPTSKGSHVMVVLFPNEETEAQGGRVTSPFGHVLASFVVGPGFMLPRCFCLQSKPQTLYRLEIKFSSALKNPHLTINQDCCMWKHSQNSTRADHFVKGKTELTVCQGLCAALLNMRG